MEPKPPKPPDDLGITFRAPEEQATVPSIDCYELALTLAAQVDELVEKAGARFHTKDALDKNSTGIAIAVARAKAEPAPADRRRYYRVARRLAVDCVTILDILQRRHSAFADQLGPAQVVAQSLVERLAILSHA